MDFFDVFIDMLRDNNFCDERLEAAVKHVISTCIYPAPTIAQFISFDKTIEVYSYQKLLEMVDKGLIKMENYYKPDKNKDQWMRKIK